MRWLLTLCATTLEFPFRSACATALAAFVVSFLITRAIDWLPLTWFGWLKEQLPGINYAVEPVIYSHCDPKIATAILVGCSIVFILGLLFWLAALVGAPVYVGLLRKSARSSGGQLAHIGRKALYIWRGSVLFLFAVALVHHSWLVGGSRDIHDQLVCGSLRPDYVQLMVIDLFGFLANYFIARAVKDFTLLTRQIGVAFPGY
jgi:hypothetical protein